MAVLNFPDSPVLDQEYTHTSTGTVYKWNGTQWVVVPAASVNIPPASTTEAGIVQLIDIIPNSAWEDLVGNAPTVNWLVTNEHEFKAVVLNSGHYNLNNQDVLNYKHIAVNGNLTENVELIFPAIYGMWTVHCNAATPGGFTLKVSPSSGTSDIFLKSGESIQIFLDPFIIHRVVQKSSTTEAGVVVLQDTITDSVTDKAPTVNAVYDALSTKADLVGGKVPTSQLPTSAALVYMGTWNATTNITSLGGAIPTAAPGNANWYFIVQVAGSTLVNGAGPWDIGDWIVSNGTVWTKIDNSNSVVINSLSTPSTTLAPSVDAVNGGLTTKVNTSLIATDMLVASNSKLPTVALVNTALSSKVNTSLTINGHALTSNVTVTQADIGLNNVNNTTDLNKPISTATQTALDLKVDDTQIVQNLSTPSTTNIPSVDAITTALAAAAGSKVHIGTSAPLTPDAGDLWFHNEKVRLFICYEDSPGIFVWVDTGSSPGLTKQVLTPQRYFGKTNAWSIFKQATNITGVPSGGANGDFKYATDTDILWVKLAGVWVNAEITAITPNGATYGNPNNFVSAPNGKIWVKNAVNMWEYTGVTDTRIIADNSEIILYTFPHNLGILPTGVHLTLKKMSSAVATNLINYNIGDIVPIPNHSAYTVYDVVNGNTRYGYSMKITTTEVIICVDSNNGIVLKDWNNTNNGSLENFNWEIGVTVTG